MINNHHHHHIKTTLISLDLLAVVVVGGGGGGGGGVTGASGNDQSDGGAHSCMRVGGGIGVDYGSDLKWWYRQVLTVLFFIIVEWSSRSDGPVDVNGDGLNLPSGLFSQKTPGQLRTNP